MSSRLVDRWIGLVADSKDESSITAFRFPRWIWLAYASLILAIAVVNVTSFRIEAARNGNPLPLTQLSVEEFTSAVVLIGLTPVLVRWSSILRPHRVGWAAALGGHLAGIAIFSLLHITAMYFLRFALFGLFPRLGTFRSDSFLMTMIYEGRKDALTYATLATGYWILALAFRRQETAAAKTAPPGMRIEIRDGARRLWLQTDEILAVEAAGNYVELLLKDRVVLRRQTLTAAEDELAELGFVRIHRSRLINRHHLVAAEVKQSGDFVVTLSDGRGVLGSRRWRRAIERFEPRSSPEVRSAG